jgi:hypothetical protein
MSDLTPTDRLLGDVLRERAGAGAPPDLHRAIVDAALADRGRGPGAAPVARARVRRARVTRFLAVAAVIGTLAAGGLLVAGGRERNDPAPSDALPSNVVEASPSSVPAQMPCSDMGKVPATPPSDYTPSTAPPRSAGSIVAVLAEPAGQRLVSVNPGGAGTVQNFSHDLAARPGIVRLTPSPDGAALAIDTVGVGSDVGYACGDPLLAVLGERAVTRPFPVGVAEVVSGATWSRDGATLYAVHRTLAEGPRRPAPDPGSVWAWDRRSATIEYLGSPCADCRVVELYPAPDRDELAAVVHTKACATPRPEFCGAAIALLDAAGGWRMMLDAAALTAALPDVGPVDVLGLASGRNLLVLVGTTVVVVPPDGTVPTRIVEAPCCHGTLDQVVLARGGDALLGLSSSSDSRSLHLVILQADGDAWSVGAAVSDVDPATGEGERLTSTVGSPIGRQVAWMGSTPDAPEFIRIAATDGPGVRDIPLDGEVFELITWMPGQ